VSGSMRRKFLKAAACAAVGLIATGSGEAQAAARPVARPAPKPIVIKPKPPRPGNNPLTGPGSHPPGVFRPR